MNDRGADTEPKQTPATVLRRASAQAGRSSSSAFDGKIRSKASERGKAIAMPYGHHGKESSTRSVEMDVSVCSAAMSFLQKTPESDGLRLACLEIQEAKSIYHVGQLLWFASSFHIKNGQAEMCLHHLQQKNTRATR